ncbi:MAG: hypothetical protein DHS20C11_30200 [Lysobacteraceae bacterium]|nr:MAG: hypothetical protein DHS20C11_30200 [Xanthomonadaceae bacterium]
MRLIVISVLLSICVPALAQPWTELELAGSKLGIRLSVTALLESVSQQQAHSQLADAQSPKPLMPSQPMSLLTLDSKALGKTYQQTILFEADHLQTLQRKRVETGKKPRQRIARYTTTGIWDIRSEPKHKDQSVADWPLTSENFLPFDREIDEPVSDASVLLVQLGQHDWAAEPQWSGYFYSRREVYLITAKVARSGQTRTDFQLHESSGSRRVKASRPSWKIEVNGSPIGKASAGAMEFLGMHGEIEIELDQELKVPLTISGKVKVAGTVTLKLKWVAP